MTSDSPIKAHSMSVLHPGDQVMFIYRFEGVAATVVRQMPPSAPDSQEARWYGDMPRYEIEWPDGRREVTERNMLATEFSFGPPEE